LVPRRDDAERRWRPNQNSAILLPKSPRSPSRTRAQPKGNGDSLTPNPEPHRPGLESRTGIQPKGNGDILRPVLVRCPDYMSRTGIQPKGNGDRTWRFLILGFRISGLVPSRDDAEGRWRSNQNSAILLPKFLSLTGIQPKGNGDGIWRYLILGFRISDLVPRRDDAERRWRPNQNSAILPPKSPRSPS
jgi:hypothetical protein